MKDFNSLQQNLKKDFSGLKKIKLAVVADSSTQFLVQAIKGYGFDQAVNFEIYEAGYNQIDLQIFNKTSALYQFTPEYIIIFQSVEKLKNKFQKSELKSRGSFADSHIQYVEKLCDTISESLQTKIIYLNFYELSDGVYGNYSNKTEESFLFQLRKINYLLMHIATKISNLFIGDMSLLQARFGRQFNYDPKMYVNADIVFSIDFLPYAAKSISDIILSTSGYFKKCLILDLDNTLWGGIIGEDGIEAIQLGDLGIGKAFSELQLWIKQLKNRGIILAVCSKNEEHIAKEPFEKHPEMILRLNDIAIFTANWNDKAENIKHIQQSLNIGLDSIVFLDDDPVERNRTRTFLPGLTVPELPSDPAEYLEYLTALNLFETASVSAEDTNRTQLYVDDVKRKTEAKNFTDENSFLATLEMKSSIKAFDKFTIPRVAQLTQRSNQFNLRTVRYSEAQIEEITYSDNFFSFVFTLEDKYGNSGLVSAIILKKQNNETAFIDTWIMSCRVFMRGLENFALNNVVTSARKKGIKKITGEYIPTEKNNIVKNFFLKMGFENQNGIWALDTTKYVEKVNFIQAVQ
ncbi:MAG: HAD family hydrolase [Bacteroidia bacterium]|nr:HAD family hydrolase [Bacteroidia bacterium]